MNNVTVRRNHSYLGKAINITCSECVSAAVVIRRVKRIHHIRTSSVAYPGIKYFPSLSYSRHDFRK